MNTNNGGCQCNPGVSSCPPMDYTQSPQLYIAFRAMTTNLVTTAGGCGVAPGGQNPNYSTVGATVKTVTLRISHAALFQQPSLKLALSMAGACVGTPHTKWGIVW